MIALSDAAWGVRRNSESQGGYFVLLMNSKALQGHMDQPYVILDSEILQATSNQQKQSEL